MKTLNFLYESKVKVSIKLNTAMDNFYESAVNVGSDNWVVLKRNLLEGGVDIKFLDKFTPSTQELAHFEDGKFDFCSYPSQLKFITLFKKYPKLKRELLKVSYPIGRRMRFDIDIERFKRSTKYNWIKFKRNFMTSFNNSIFNKTLTLFFLVSFIFSFSQTVYSQTLSEEERKIFEKVKKEHNEREARIKIHESKFLPLSKRQKELLSFRNKKTICLFYDNSCGLAIEMKKHFDKFKTTYDTNLVSFKFILVDPPVKKFINNKEIIQPKTKSQELVEISEVMALPQIFFINEKGESRRRIGYTTGYEPANTKDKISQFLQNGNWK
jgi:hypothetical protein